MAGIMQRAMRPQEEQAPTEVPAERPAQQQPAQPGQGGAPSPQDQEAYDRLVASSMKILYDDPTHQGILKTLQAGAKNPEQVLAQVVVMIVTELDRKAGGKIPKNIILPAAEEIIAMIAELAAKAGFFQADEKMIQRALAAAVSQFAEHYKAGRGEVESMLQRVGAKREAPPDMMQGAQAQGVMPQGGM